MFRESVRDRVPYNLVVFAVLLIASSFFIGQLTAGQDVKIIKDLGLAATSIFGVFMAVFIGIGLVAKEVEKRSIYALLAKPISRPQLLLGKYAGLVLTLAVNLAVMAVAIYAVLAYMAWSLGPDAAKGWERPATNRPKVSAADSMGVEKVEKNSAIAVTMASSQKVRANAFSISGSSAGRSHPADVCGGAIQAM